MSSTGRGQWNHKPGWDREGFTEQRAFERGLERTGGIHQAEIRAGGLGKPRISENAVL